MDSLIVPLGCCSSYSRRIDYSFSSWFLPFGRVFLGLSSLWIPGESSCLSETLELNQIRNLMADFLRALPRVFLPSPPWSNWGCFSYNLTSDFALMFIEIITFSFPSLARENSSESGQEEFSFPPPTRGSSLGSSFPWMVKRWIWLSSSCSTEGEVQGFSLASGPRLLEGLL